MNDSTNGNEKKYQPYFWFNQAIGLIMLVIFCLILAAIKFTGNDGLAIKLGFYSSFIGMVAFVLAFIGFKRVADFCSEHKIDKSEANRKYCNIAIPTFFLALATPVLFEYFIESYKPPIVTKSEEAIVENVLVKKGLFSSKYTIESSLGAYVIRENLLSTGQSFKLQIRTTDDGYYSVPVICVDDRCVNTTPRN